MTTPHDTGLVAEPVARLIEELNKLPGVGPATARRLTYYLLRAPAEQANRLSAAIVEMKTKVAYCRRCFNYAVGELCAVCANPNRDQTKVCVVEQPLDILAVERTNAYRGLYHVLHGHVAPIDGVYPEDLKIEELVQRTREEPIDEVILATNPNTEGEATTWAIHQRLVPLGIRLTRLARGLPTGGDLEWADPGTLGSALEGRREL
jgi:recombination protein RecR